MSSIFIKQLVTKRTFWAVAYPSIFLLSISITVAFLAVTKSDSISTASDLPTTTVANESAENSSLQPNPLIKSDKQTTTTDSQTSTPEVGITSYAGNLARIKASTVRNTKEDESPFIETPSTDLYDKPSLYGSAADYLTGRGEYGGSEFFPGGYFPGNGAGTFRASCEASHFSYDDPMVFPGKPEAAHLHMFIGNTHTNAHTTYDTLLNSGGSTCNGGELNRTAYWVPAMFNGEGDVVVPSKILFYYKTEKEPGIGKVQEYPENLQLLGDTKNNIQNNLDMATFRCNSIYNGAKAQPSATIPSCPSTPKSTEPGALEFMIYFDYCWNGNESTIDDWEANRDTNFASPLNFWHSSVCPDTHPIILPALVTHIFYDIKPGEDTSKWFLSSDVNPKNGDLPMPGGQTAHADWFGAWNKEVNKEWNTNCSNIMDAECASGLLADPEGDPNSDVRALRLRNDFITGYNSPKARIPVKDIYEQMCSKADTEPFDPAQGGKQAAYCHPGGKHNH